MIGFRRVSGPTPGPHPSPVPTAARHTRGEIWRLGDSEIGRLGTPSPLHPFTLSPRLRVCFFWLDHPGHLWLNWVNEEKRTFPIEPPWAVFRSLRGDRAWRERALEGLRRDPVAGFGPVWGQNRASGRSRRRASQAGSPVQGRLAGWAGWFSACGALLTGCGAAHFPGLRSKRKVGSREKGRIGPGCQARSGLFQGEDPVQAVFFG